MKNFKLTVMMLVAVTLVVVSCYIVFSKIDVAEVEGLSLAASTPSSQTLKWNNDSNHTAYEIYRCDDGSGNFKLLTTVDAAKGTEYVSEKLNSASLYGYQIIAVNKFLGKEYKSDPVSIKAYTSPNSVSNFSAATKSEKSLTVVWDDVQNVDGYNLCYSKNADMNDAKNIDFGIEQAVSDRANGTLTYLIPDLSEDSTYYLKLRCYLADGDVKSYSEWSEIYSAKVTKAIDMTGVDITKPMVALTFDDGPDYSNVTNTILDVIESCGGKATFFQIGERASELPSVMKRIAQGGHEIGCHTYDHEHYGSSVTNEDIVKGNDVIEKACHQRPSSFRSTGGMTTDQIREICKAEGMPLYYWTLDTRDWESRDADAVVNSIQNYVSDGDIILMHNIYNSTAQAVQRVVPWLADQGYQLVTVSQLIQAKTGAPPVPGRQYYSATRYD